MTEVPASAERFMGFAQVYDQFRPSPPPELAAVLCQIIHTTHPALVVDIGSGTGLATGIWPDYATQIVGIEPSYDMRIQAQKNFAQVPNVHFRDGISTHTGLPDACADIVTVAQALHWMEPEGTFAEIARILRPGGVFASIDNDWPPIMNWQAEQVIFSFRKRERRLRKKGLYDREEPRTWAKPGHMERIEKCGHFRYTREFMMHRIDQGNAERAYGLELSMGSVQTLLKAGLTEDEIGLPDFRAEMQRILGSIPRAFYWTYRIRIGVK